MGSSGRGLYRDRDFETVVPRKNDYRSPARRDLARLVHSPAFRRLQGKTQLFSGLESDFFRNRLTHSLEVAQIAQSLALHLNQKLPADWQIDLDVVEFAGLAHDLGHPPFGHTGELVLHQLMGEHGGFEGNAQTLRLLARLEKKLDQPDRPEWRLLYQGEEDVAVGLNLSARTLAAILKYDRPIPAVADRDPGTGRYRLTKGYYGSEAPLVAFVRRQVLGDGCTRPLKTVECQIMDLADDIAYSTYDVEDAFKAGISTPLHLLAIPPALQEKVRERANKELKAENYGVELTFEQVHEVIRDIFSFVVSANALETFQTSRAVAEQGLLRSSFTSFLVGNAIRAVELTPDRQNPALSVVRMAEEQRIQVSVLKHLTYFMVIESNKLKLVSHRGEKIVETVFNTLSEKPDLLPEDFQERYDQAPAAKKPRVVADFVAGMTDRFAVEFYARLTSEDFRSMFQPH